MSQYSQLPFERVRLLEDYTDFRARDIGLAVLFLVAPWNDRCLQALSEITQAMFEFPSWAFDYYAARLEGFPLSLLREAFHGSWIQGSGETIWIRGGEVFDSRTGYPEGKAGEIFVEVTRRMLKEMGF